MGLYERIMGLENPRIPAHQLQAMLAERRRGNVTNNQVGNAFGLSPAEAAEVGTLVQRVIDGAVEVKELDDVLLLASSRTPPYNTVNAVKTRLGV